MRILGGITMLVGLVLGSMQEWQSATIVLVVSTLLLWFSEVVNK